MRGSRRLISYWYPSILSRNFPIYNSLLFYKHSNHSLAILADLGSSKNVILSDLLKKEQYFLDYYFSEYPNNIINLAVIAGSTLGIKHSAEFSAKRSGIFSPIFGKIKSPEFIKMQLRDKRGKNNPQYGVIKLPETINKLSKFISVYSADDNSYIGTFKTVECSKYFKIGKDTLMKYVNTGKPFKGKLFWHKKHNELFAHYN